MQNIIDMAVNKRIQNDQSKYNNFMRHVCVVFRDLKGTREILSIGLQL